MAFPDTVVAHPSVTQVGLGDHLQSLQQFHSTVDRRDIHLGIMGTDLGVYLLGTDVAVRFFYGSQYHYALWCQPVA